MSRFLQLNAAPIAIFFMVDGIFNADITVLPKAFFGKYDMLVPSYPIPMQWPSFTLIDDNASLTMTSIDSYAF